MKKLILSLSLLMALSNSSLYCMNGGKASLDQETRIEKLRKEVEELTLMRKLNKLKNEEKAESQTCGQLAKNGITTSIGACFVAGSVYKQANVVYQEALNKESLLNIVSGEKAFGAVGGANQYRTEQTAKELLENGFIKESSETYTYPSYKFGKKRGKLSYSLGSEIRYLRSL